MFLCGLTFGVVGPSLSAQAQPAGKVYRIGMLAGRSEADSQRLLIGFRKGLEERGWVEGQNFIIDPRYAGGRPERMPALVAELVDLKVDVIVITAGDPGALVAKQATATIPIVTLSIDPVGVGLVPSLAKPGGNITGVSILAAEVAAKRLQILRETVPRMTRVAVLWNSADPGKDMELRQTEGAARVLGVTLQPVEVRGPDDFDKAFATIVRGRPDAMVTFSEPLTLVHRQRIVDFAAKNRLPMISEIREFADAGGLMTYGPSLAQLVHLLAKYVDRILKGTKPGDLPIEQPTQFELVINMKTAKALGLTISPTLLLRADQLIE